VPKGSHWAIRNSTANGASAQLTTAVHLFVKRSISEPRSLSSFRPFGAPWSNSTLIDTTIIFSQNGFENHGTQVSFLNLT
jgi:hypothetical protein